MTLDAVLLAAKEGKALGPEFWEAERERLFETISPHLARAAREGARAGAEFFRGAIEVDWTLVNASAQRWASLHALELVNDIDLTTRGILAQFVAEWAASGEPLSTLQSQLEGSGILSEARADRIAVTEVTRAYAEGNLVAWREMPFKVKMRWMTAEDDIVDDVCIDLSNGGPYELNEIEPPPAHVNCRCWLMPVVADEALEAEETDKQRYDAALEDIERQMPSLKVEHGYILDNAGNLLIHRTQGNPSAVYWSDRDQERIRELKGRATLAHNHPRNFAFSPDDLIFASNNNLGAIRARSPLYTHIATPGKGGWPENIRDPRLAETAVQRNARIRAIDEFVKDWHSLGEEEARKIIAVGSRGFASPNEWLLTLSREQVEAHNVEATHRGVQRLAEKWGFNYRRVEG